MATRTPARQGAHQATAIRPFRAAPSGAGGAPSYPARPRCSARGHTSNCRPAWCRLGIHLVQDRFAINALVPIPGAPTVLSAGPAFPAEAQKMTPCVRTSSVASSTMLGVKLSQITTCVKLQERARRGTKGGVAAPRSKLWLPTTRARDTPPRVGRGGGLAVAHVDHVCACDTRARVRIHTGVCPARRQMPPHASGLPRRHRRPPRSALASVYEVFEPLPTQHGRKHVSYNQQPYQPYRTINNRTGTSIPALQPHPTAAPPPAPVPAPRRSHCCLAASRRSSWTESARLQETKETNK
jgi:hypothetical protein